MAPPAWWTTTLPAAKFLRQGNLLRRTRPRDILDLSLFHQSLCDGISARLDDPVKFYPLVRRTDLLDNVNVISTGEPQLFCPMPSEKVQPWRDHKFTLGHLFRALYMVIDDQVLKGYEGPPLDLKLNDDVRLDLEMRYERKLSQCEVLLVKTGDESHLDSPLSFQPLFDAGLALNVNRQDHESNTEETVVRVKIDVAVHFVWDKLCKERNALANLGQAAQELEEEQRGLCEAWTDRVMIHAEEIGIDVNGFTWQAARRALARLDGEAFDEEQVTPWHESLRHWEG